ncbi:MAG TPA: VOC family protein [Burkholderiales bacterium]|nr:VOC family protein [Burkholderiales bacterium]
MPFDPTELKGLRPPRDLPFRIRKLGHIVLRASDLRRSVAFYTQVLGFEISDIYPDEMVPGGMVFLRCNPDHHGVALVGGMPGPSEKRELHHFAFEVATLDEVFLARKRLREQGVPIVFEGRRRAGVQLAVEFLDPDGHHLEIYWGLDQVGPDGRVRPKSEWREAHTLEEALDNPPPGQSVQLADPSLVERR